MTYPYEPTHGWGPNLEEFLKEGCHAWGEGYHDSQYSGDFECCVACGRRTTEGKGITVVLGGGGAELLDPADIDEAAHNDPGFMGMWLVGPECGKKIPADFRKEA